MPTTTVTGRRSRKWSRRRRRAGMCCRRPGPRRTRRKRSASWTRCRPASPRRLVSSVSPARAARAAPVPDPAGRKGFPLMNDPIPAWPGEPVALASVEVYVRSAPADVPAGAAGAQPALFVHGLGGSSTNWTDLMGLLRRPAAAGPCPPAPALAGQAIDLPGPGRWRLLRGRQGESGDRADRARSPLAGAPDRELARRRRLRPGRGPPPRPDPDADADLTRPAGLAAPAAAVAGGGILRPGGRPPGDAPAGPAARRGQDPRQRSRGLPESRPDASQPVCRGGGRGTPPGWPRVYRRGPDRVGARARRRVPPPGPAFALA